MLIYQLKSKIMIHHLKKIIEGLFDPENKKSISTFFIFGFLIIFFQLLYLIYKISVQLEIPTVQTEAKLKLIKFAQANDIQKRKAIYSNSLSKRIMQPKPFLIPNFLKFQIRVIRSNLYSLLSISKMSI